MIEIIDTPVDVRRYLPRLGDVHTIIRYITRGSPSGSKHVKLPEVQAIKATGKKLALVHETFGDFAHAGRGGVSRADGVQDGPYARNIMPKLGATAGAACYFAVDCDASAAQIRNNVIPYFEAIRAAFADGEYRVGVYGPGVVCQAVKDAGLADLFWLSNAKGWKGYNAFKPQADLVQERETKIAGGLDVDPNVAVSEDWGQFEPFGEDTAMLTDDTPRRLAQGDDVADNHAVLGSVSSGFDGIKSVFKSKIAWLGGGLGGTAASSSLSTDPETMNLLSQLTHRPVFWVALGAIVVTGLVIYYRWRDHGKGSVQ